MTTLNRLLIFIARIPATIFLFVVFIFIGIITGSIISPEDIPKNIERIGYGLVSLQHGDITSIFVGLFAFPSGWPYLGVVLLFLLAAAYTEWRYGTLKMITISLASHIGSVLVAAVIIALLAALGSGWAQSLVAVKDVGISNALFGLLGALTIVLPGVWRLRGRVTLIFFCVAMLVYSGNIWDLTHFIGALIGLCFGSWLLKGAIARNSSIAHLTARSVAAGLVIFHAIASVVTAFHATHEHAIAVNTNNEAAAQSFVVVVASVFLSLLFAYGLYRGRRVAWLAILILSSISFIISVVGGFHIITLFNTLTFGALVFVLIMYRSSFRVRIEKGRIVKLIIGLIVCGIAILFIHATILYFVLGPTQPVTYGEAVLLSALQTIGVPVDSSEVTGRARFVLESIDYLWLVYILGTITALVLSTRRIVNDITVNAYKKALRTNGSYSLSWMGTWNRMSHWTSKNGSMTLAYHLTQNTAIVLGNPIGPRVKAKAYLKEFEMFCQQHGWIVTYFAVDTSFARILNSLGYGKAEIAEDTIIRLPELSLSGKSWQSVRSAINRAEKMGIRMERFAYQDASQKLKMQLNQIADSWVADKTLPEMGFTLGTLREASDPDVRMHIAIDEQGIVHGMSSWLPIYSKDEKVIGYTIDIMQRSLAEDAMPGVMEYLIAESALVFQEDGLEYISLSAAPLAGSNGNTSVDTLLKFLSEKLEPFYGFTSLHRFKQKFQPEQEPLYLCYKDSAELPAIALAITKAYMNDVNLITTGIRSMFHKKNARK